MRRFAFVFAIAGLAACDRPPQPPDKTAPPEPQVAASTAHSSRDRIAGRRSASDAPAIARDAHAGAAHG